MGVEPLCAQLDADAQVGLTQDNAARRLRQSGPNELPEAPPTSILTLLLFPGARSPAKLALEAS